MDAQVIINGNDVSAYLLNLSREHNYCNISQTFNLELVLDNPFSINPYNSVVIYEEGDKVLTGFVNSTKKNAIEGTISVLGQDEYKRAEDYFIETTYTTSVNQTVAYWINTLTDLCGLNVEYTHGNGPFVVKEQEIGLDTVANILVYLIQYAGWYGHINEDGVLILGKIEKEDEPILIQNTILSVDYEKSYDKTRNVALIFGGIDDQEDQFTPVFAKSRVELPFLPTDQTVVVGNHLIGDQGTAESFANELILAFSEPQFVKNLEIIGDSRLRSGIYIEVESPLFTGLALISSISSNFSQDGYRMRLILDDLCPRFSVAPVQQDILYAGTWGSGVWKRNLNSGTWRNISSGLENLYINDLSVDDGLFITSTPSGVYTKLNRDDWFYEDLPLVGSGVTVSGELTYPAVYASSFDNEFYALVTLSGLATNYTWVYRGFLEDDFVTWSGYPIQIQEDSVTRNGAGYIGKDLEGYEFDKYITVERSKVLNGFLVAGKPSSSDDFDIYFEDLDTANAIQRISKFFTEISMIKVSPNGLHIAIVGKRLTDTINSLYITSLFSAITKFSDSDFTTVHAIGWHPDNNQFIFQADSVSAGDYRFYHAVRTSSFSISDLGFSGGGQAIYIDIKPDFSDHFAWILKSGSNYNVMISGYSGGGSTIATLASNTRIKNHVLWYPNDYSKVLFSEEISGVIHFSKINIDATGYIQLTDVDIVSDKLNAHFTDETGSLIMYPGYDTSEAPDIWRLYEMSPNYIENNKYVVGDASSFNPSIRYDGQKLAFSFIDTIAPFPSYIKTNNLDDTNSQNVYSLGNNIQVSDVKYSLSDNRIMYMISNGASSTVNIVNDDGTNHTTVLTGTDIWTFLDPYYDAPFTAIQSLLNCYWVPNSNKILIEVTVNNLSVVISYDLTNLEFALVAPVTNSIGTPTDNYLISDIYSDGTYAIILHQEPSGLLSTWYTERVLISNPDSETPTVLFIGETEAVASSATAFVNNNLETIVYHYKTGIYLSDINMQNSSLLATGDSVYGFSYEENYVCYSNGGDIKIANVNGNDNRVIVTESSANGRIVPNPVNNNHLVYEATPLAAGQQRAISVFFRTELDIEFFDLDYYSYLKANVYREPLLLHTVSCSGTYDVLFRNREFSEVNVDTYIPISVYGSGGVWYSGDEGFNFNHQVAQDKNVFDMAVKTTTAGAKMMFATTNDGIYRTLSSGTPTIINSVDATEIVARTYGSGEVFFSIEDEVKQSNNNGLSYFDISANLPNGYDITVLRLER